MKRIPIVGAAESLLEAGVMLFQYRLKGHFGRTDYEVLQTLAELCRGGGAGLVVNDRADIAKMAGAGLHVGQEDLAPADGRLIVGSEAMLGYSTHNAEQLRAGDAEPVDYLAIGPIFATRSKENPDPVVGVEALPALRRLTRKPLVAIGGITLENAAQVYAGGVDSVALISALIPEDGGLKEMRRRAEEWLALGRAMRIAGEDRARDMV